MALENESPSSAPINAADIAADISRDLFGNGADENTASADPPSREASTGQAGSESVPPSSPPTTPSGKPLPKSWKKEMETYWNKLDPQLHDYIHQREADVMRGIQQYSDSHKRWNTLLEPYQEVFSRHKDVDPVQVMQGLMNTHLSLLSNAPPEQKRAQLLEIAKAYGVDFAQSVANADAAGASPDNVTKALQERLDKTEAMLQRVTQHLSQGQRASYEAGVAKHLEEVNRFAADPKNAFFESVAEDIKLLISSGVAKDLPSAYELACLKNPEIRGKYLAAQQENNSLSGNPSGRKAPLNIESPDRPSSRKVNGATMDDTIASVVKKHFSASSL